MNDEKSQHDNTSLAWAFQALVLFGCLVLLGLWFRHWCPLKALGRSVSMTIQLLTYYYAVWALIGYIRREHQWIEDQKSPLLWVVWVVWFQAVLFSLMIILREWETGLFVFSTFPKHFRFEIGFLAAPFLTACVGFLSLAYWLIAGYHYGSSNRIAPGA